MISALLDNYLYQNQANGFGLKEILWRRVLDVTPLAIACLYNSDTRSSFYTWVRQMVGCYMLYPGFIIASVFSDLIVVNYVQQRPWSVVLMVIFSFILKLTMLATVKATVNKWL